MKTIRIGLTLLMALMAPGGIMAGQPGGLPAGGTAMEPLRSRGLAAEVGGQPVFLDTVLETWGPFWHDIAGKVRSGKLSAADGDRQLREEWEKALEAAVKDEMFYSEAVREFEGLLAEFIERMYDSQGRGAGGGKMSRAMVDREIRREFSQGIERDAARVESQMLKASGGAAALAQSLAARGITYDAWRERLRRKAFTMFYFSRRASLRLNRPGPGQISAYYRAHPDKFRRPDMVAFRHVFFSNEKRGADNAYNDAVTAWQDLTERPERFDEIARARSDDPVSAPRGGQDFFNGESDPSGRDWLGDVARAAKEERPGALGPLLDSPFGYHVAVLMEMRPGGRIPFAEVRDSIEGQLTAEAEAVAMERLYQSLRRDVPVRVVAATFPGEFSCARLTVRPGRPPERSIGGDGYPRAGMR